MELWTMRTPEAGTTVTQAQRAESGGRFVLGGGRAVVAEVGRRYDSRVHLRNDAAHTAVLDAAFVDRFAVVGPPERCVARLTALADLGVDRFVITGPSFGATRDDARTAERLLTGEVLPALRSSTAREHRRA